MIPNIEPNASEQVARVCCDLRLGLPVTLRTRARQALVLASETGSDARIAALVRSGHAVMALTARRAATLKARAYDGEMARVRIPRASPPGWVRAVADPSVDLMYPLKGPFETERGGATAIYRAGIDLARLARLLPAVIVSRPTKLNASAIRANVQVLDLDDDLTGLKLTRQPTQVAKARLPLPFAQNARIHVFRIGLAIEEHCAVVIGQPPRDEPPLVRLHSACLTGDVLGSLKCDCGQQLHLALDYIGKEQQGVLLYLSQEGRGIGLSNKIRAYALQDQGFDTVEANLRLGFEDDERDFRVGSEILKQMGFEAVRLLTNNPLKVRMMEEFGVKVVEMISVLPASNPHNQHYLTTKASKSGHIL